MCFDTVGSVHQRIRQASVGMVAGRVRGMLWGGVPVLRQCGACASQPPPPPQISEVILTNRRTNRRTDFSAKQAPSALDLSPRPLTHLPYGCSIVAFMWKRRISLNFENKFFVSGSLHGP